MSETCFVLCPYLKSQKEIVSEEAKLEEISSLALAIDLEVIQRTSIPLRQITPATYIGKGSIQNIKELYEENEDALKPSVIIVDCSLGPIQQRNLEKALHTKVIDRTGLILEIFGKRAQTKEGQLQVELAALDYQKSRLVRSWTHLERQRGGAGFMGGPGERQIEIDRRLINERITQIKKDIEKVKKNRALQRRAREQVPYPVVALVGYTNAGKSTLFNKLTKAKVLAKDMLFATLDTTMRKLKLPSGQDVILSDTVGFISDLPTHLIAAFRATLEQLEYADVILHVQDISNPDHENQRIEVEKILKDFELEPDSEKLIQVYNKIDAIADDEAEQALRFINKNEAYISSLKGIGFEELLIKIAEHMESQYRSQKIKSETKNGKLISWLHTNSKVKNQDIQETHTILKIDIHPREWGRFKQLFADSFEML